MLKMCVPQCARWPCYSRRQVLAGSICLCESISSAWCRVCWCVCVLVRKYSPSPKFPSHETQGDIIPHHASYVIFLSRLNSVQQICI